MGRVNGWNVSRIRGHPAPCHSGCLLLKCFVGYLSPRSRLVHAATHSPGILSSLDEGALALTYQLLRGGLNYARVVYQQVPLVFGVLKSVR